MSLNQWGKVNIWSEEAGGVTIAVTEYKSARVDSASASFNGFLLSSVTEVKTPRQDSSTLNIPITITINPKNIVRVKRKSNKIIVK